MSKFIAHTQSDVLSKALFDAGVIRDRPEDVHRIVIDLKAGAPATIYVQLYADTDTLDVLLQGGLNLVIDEAA